MAAAAADEADEGGDWEADVLDEDVRRGGVGWWSTVHEPATLQPEAVLPDLSQPWARWLRNCWPPGLAPTPHIGSALARPLQPLIGGTGPLAMSAEEEDESLFDDTLPSSTDDLREAAMSRRHMLSASPTYASPQAGPRQAAAILLAAVAEMGAQPSEADFAAVATWAAGAGAADAAVLLVAALDRQAQPVAGTTGLRAQMAELYEARAVAEGGDVLEVALAELLQPMGDPEADAGASLFEGELAEWMEACDAASLTNAMR